MDSFLRSSNILASMLIALLISIFAAPLSAEACLDSSDISIHCGSTPSASFDDNGVLWVAFVQDEFVYVSHSSDLGKSYSNPVAVNSIAEDAEHNGENRPKIIVDESGIIYVSWTLKTSPRFTGEIRFSRSIDNGNTFEETRTINDDGLFTGHRFESLFLSESGHLYLTWVDKRDLEASLKKEEPYVGAAVYYAVSDDQGRSFSKNYRVANHSCECCRIAIAPKGPENIAILWRQVFGEDVRDHAISELSPYGDTLQTHRASFDEWHINACPHHGPAMVQSSISNDYHMSWFTNGDVNQGIYYAKFSFNTNEPSQLYRVDRQPGAGHPYLAESEETLYLVWKGFNGTEALLNIISSEDDGKSWSNATTLVTTDKGSDYPFFVKRNEDVFLSWHTQEYGHIFIDINQHNIQISDNDL